MNSHMNQSRTEAREKELVQFNSSHLLSCLGLCVLARENERLGSGLEEATCWRERDRQQDANTPAPGSQLPAPGF